MNLSNENQPKRKVMIELDATTYATLEQLKAIDSIPPKVRVQNIIRTIISKGEVTAHTGI